jgi:hypothetical protein
MVIVTGPMGESREATSHGLSRETMVLVSVLGVPYSSLLNLLCVHAVEGYRRLLQ